MAEKWHINNKQITNKQIKIKRNDRQMKNKRRPHAPEFITRRPEPFLRELGGGITEGALASHAAPSPKKRHVNFTFQYTPGLRYWRLPGGALLCGPGTCNCVAHKCSSVWMSLFILNASVFSLLIACWVFKSSPSYLPDRNSWSVLRTCRKQQRDKIGT